ncbi:flagellar hook-basal body complex protein [Epibacterium sp. SM1979]|uniref:Flagellar hook protein FlgE n=2 Tax=Tritonibacter litoralis TaxID=2662264 RepID=A0A843YGB1_9RHOB|nr:flagellar hook-basal body complex protein [Tritonibacter litoralis]
MTISSSLNAGVAGLTANAARLATISDNISNSSTPGYKRVQSDFNSLVIGSSGSGYTAGGVRATSSRVIDEQGSRVGTNNATDLAINGRGMLPVANITEVESGILNPAMLLTSTGSFNTNDDGVLTTESGLVLMGWPALPDGSIPNFPRDTTSGLEPIVLNRSQLSSEPTTEVNLGINLPATSTEAGGTPDPADTTTTIAYYDNLGRAEGITVEFEATVPASGTSNEWTMRLTDSASGGALIGEYTLTFNDSQTDGGSLASVTAISGGAYDATTGSVIVNVAGGAIEVDVGLIGRSNGLTQLGDEWVAANISRDGAPAGNIVDVQIDQNGFVLASFDSGITRTVYQVPLVDVPNMNGLQTLDRQTFLPTTDSGSFFLWDAGSGPVGDVASFALEESNADVATELTQMITTQRAYSSSAKVIQTVDEMLQETTNIKR